MKFIKSLSIMSFVIAYLMTGSVSAGQVDTNSDGIVSGLEVKSYIEMQLNTLTCRQKDSSGDIDQLLPEVYD